MKRASYFLCTGENKRPFFLRKPLYFCQFHLSFCSEKNPQNLEKTRFGVLFLYPFMTIYYVDESVSKGLK